MSNCDLWPQSFGLEIKSSTYHRHSWRPFSLWCLFLWKRYVSFRGMSHRMTEYQKEIIWRERILILNRWFNHHDYSFYDFVLWQSVVMVLPSPSSSPSWLWITLTPFSKMSCIIYLPFSINIIVLNFITLAKIALASFTSFPRFFTFTVIRTCHARKFSWSFRIQTSGFWPSRFDILDIESEKYHNSPFLIHSSYRGLTETFDGRIWYPVFTFLYPEIHAPVNTSEP